MNRKLLLYIAAVAILQPSALQAKPKKALAKNIVAENPAQPIGSSYFLQITVAENDCEKLLGQSCIFRDKMFGDLYSHETKLVIFLDKIFATQSYNDKTTIMQVKNGTFTLATDSNNLISFHTKEGTISDLKLVKGDLSKEQNNVSKCRKAENLYNFYNIYNNGAILTKSGIYRDEYDFKGLNEYILFSEKDDQPEIMALTKGDDQKTSALDNLQLCRMPNSDILNVRHLNVDECYGDNKMAEECFKYQECENVIAVENCEVTLFKDGFN